MSLHFKFTAKNLIAKGKISREDVDAIKVFLKELDEKYVPKKLPKEFIATILIACSNDVDLTKSTIISYFNVKQMAPSLFDNRNVDNDDIQLGLRTECYASIRWPEENTEIIYIKLRDTNYKNCHMDVQFKTSIMVMDAAYVTTPTDNVIVVHDIQGFGLMHLTRVKLDSLKVFFSYVQDGLPVNLKAVHFINSNYIVNKFMSISRLFIKPEHYKKIHFHRGIEGLTNYIPKRYIPNEYDGNLSSMENYHINVMTKLKGMQKYWDGEESLRKQCILNKE